MIRIDSHPGPLVQEKMRSALRRPNCTALLHGGDIGPNRWSTWSYDPGPPLLLIRCDASTGVTILRDARGPVRTWPDPLSALAWMAGTLAESPADGPPFKGGWVGWLGYDLGRWFETLPQAPPDDLGLPLFEFTYHDDVWAYDHAAGRGYHVRAAHDFTAEPLELSQQFARGDSPVRCNFTRAAYELAVACAVEYIAAGDVFQVNLSQRFTAGLSDDPARIYERLIRGAPALYGAYLSYGEHALLCNSPELFLRIDPGPGGGSRRITTRPIKGTRPLGQGMQSMLQASMKDQAELNMIVDLERNDLGRVCRVGSVKVLEPRVIEAHPTVYHGAATIEGMLRDDVSLVELLRATFPGGSITGAPKIRAMQIIDQLEPVRRGPYCGAIGYLSVDGHAELNVAIRTIIVHGNAVHIPVGGGIVADSDPAAEYEETLVKARAMFAALGINAPEEA